MYRLNLFYRISIFAILISFLSIPNFSKETRKLDLNSTLDIALTNSYRVKKLELGIKNQMYKLEAQKDALKSSVYMNIKAPEIKNIADTKWNSELQQDEIVHQNTQLWQTELTVKQPVILFGFPTDGYVSLNYKVYRYQQLGETDDVKFYNRLYFQFDQPFFLPNNLKNNLERAELNLEQRKMEYLSDRMHIIEDISNDYYRLFRIVYLNNLYEEQLATYGKVIAIASEKTKVDSSRKADLLQVELEKSNLKESYLDNSSNLRNEIANLKQKLRINSNDSLIIDTNIDIHKLEIKTDEAVELAEKLNPWLKWDIINKRKAEIQIDEAASRNAFHVNLHVSYGLENQNDKFANIWDKFENSNSISLNAYVPIWDWGRRDAQIAAEKINVKRQMLDIQEQRESIRKNIKNLIINQSEYQERAINLKKSTELASEFKNLSIKQYENNEISVQDLLKVLGSYFETERKFLNVYISYRSALLYLKVNSFYDFEKEKPIFSDVDLKSLQ